MRRRRLEFLQSKLFQEKHDGAPRYEQIARTLEQLIQNGSFRKGDRLPPIRQLAQELEVSDTTIAAAYRMVSNLGWTRGEAGRGTLVIGEEAKAAVARVNEHRTATVIVQPDGTTPWRRRALIKSAVRLRSAYPTALDCTSGRPDPSLLPVEIVKRRLHYAIETLGPEDLQYGGPEITDALAQAVMDRLLADGVAVQRQGLVAASSAQQLMMLALRIVAARAGSGSSVLVAVEEPGYPTIFDAFESAGAKLIGVEVDDCGAIPASLDIALSRGVQLVLLTPRAHNPTGASWSVSRLRALADVLMQYPHAIVVEDDQFADLACTNPGSLLSDPRIENRIVYIRSFSKSIGPDLRVAVAAARPVLHSILLEAKSLLDGWTSRLAQRALAGVLLDEELPSVLERARAQYAERRAHATLAINRLLDSAGGAALRAADGVNVWVRLPGYVDAADVLERAAPNGTLAAPGEPFFIRPGWNQVLRLNAGAVPTAAAANAGEGIARAALDSGSKTHYMAV